MISMLVVGAVVVAIVVVYATQTHPYGLTGPVYHQAKKSILGALVMRGRFGLRGWLAQRLEAWLGPRPAAAIRRVLGVNKNR